MSSPDWSPIIDELRAAGVGFADGLSDDEIHLAEETYNFLFPPDLRNFLQTALPSGEPFPNWRENNVIILTHWLHIPHNGILFDIEHNDFWLPEWGEQPTSLEDRMRVAEDLLATAPKLIPIYKHRMMPSLPHEEGNPVFSVHQTDIMYYGYDLEDYLRHEFKLPGRKERPSAVKQIPFWDIERFQEVRWKK